MLHKAVYLAIRCNLQHSIGFFRLTPRS